MYTFLFILLQWPGNLSLGSLSSSCEGIIRGAKETSLITDCLPSFKDTLFNLINCKMVRINCTIG